MTPDFSALRAERSACPSDATLEEYGFDALPADEAQTVGAHVEGCAACTEAVALIRQGFDAFPQLDERRVLARVHTALEARPPWWRRLGLLLVPVMIGGAAAIVLMTREAPDPDAGGGLAGPTSGVRAKGGPKLQVFAKTGAEAPRELLSGQPVAPGSRLQFMVTLDAPGYVQVLGVEPSGTLYTAWPLLGALAEHQAANRPLPAGEHRLPGGAALDDAVGEERLHLVWCPTAPPRCTAAGPTAPLACPPGCLQTQFALKKAR